MTSRHDILSALKKATIREVEVAGIKVNVRGLTGAERVQLAMRVLAAKEDPSKRLADSELCSWAICDADGNRVFQDASELADIDGKALETIALAILDASELRKEDEERAAGELPASPS